MIHDKKKAMAKEFFVIAFFWLRLTKVSERYLSHTIEGETKGVGRLWWDSDVP